MKDGVLKAVAVAGGCGLLAFLPWAPRPGRQTTPPPDQQATPPAPTAKENGQPARPKAHGVAVRIEAVGSQYALPGTWVDVFWVRAPKSPERHHKLIVQDALILTLDGYSDRDGELINCITLEVTAEQAERLKRAQKVGWLRALQRPLVAGDPDGGKGAKDEPSPNLLPPATD